MSAFRKKPVVISAEGPITEAQDIATLEGTMRASIGDYIITGVQGERYPCKPDIFAATYGPATGAPALTREQARTLMELEEAAHLVAFFWGTDDENLGQQYQLPEFDARVKALADAIMLAMSNGSRTALRRIAEGTP